MNHIQVPMENAYFAYVHYNLSCLETVFVYVVYIFFVYIVTAVIVTKKSVELCCDCFCN